MQDRLADEARRRFEAPRAAAAVLVIAGNHPWPGDPMQSFTVLLQHRAACRKGGVLAGFFWTQPGEIDRSFPPGLLRGIAATGGARGLGGPPRPGAGRPVAAATGSPAAFMIRWARGLVVDRTILVAASAHADRPSPRAGALLRRPGRPVSAPAAALRPPCPAEAALATPPRSACSPRGADLCPPARMRRIPGHSAYGK